MVQNPKEKNTAGRIVSLVTPTATLSLGELQSRYRLWRIYMMLIDSLCFQHQLPLDHVRTANLLDCLMPLALVQITRMRAIMYIECSRIMSIFLSQAQRAFPYYKTNIFLRIICWCFNRCAGLTPRFYFPAEVHLGRIFIASQREGYHSETSA